MNLEVIWRQVAGTGAEHLVLNSEMGGEIHADGLAVGEVYSRAYRIRYRLDLDADWDVRRMLIESLLDGRSVELTASGDGNWRDGNGKTLAGLAGCEYVDLMVTPFTNTLPIRRLKLKAGDARDIAVAYISAPDLAVSRSEQRYTCLTLAGDGATYRYDNLQSGFHAVLRVDDDGLVVDYPGAFVMDAKRSR